MKQQTTELQCDICGATFRDRDALTKHLRVHERAEAEGHLEQGTQPPAESPSMPPNVPQPIHADGAG